MPNTIANHAVGILVLLPSTLVASFWSLFGVAFVEDSLRRSENFIAGISLLVAMILGWFGLVIAWRLYYAFQHGRTNFNRPIAWAGLICGSVASLGLIATSGGSLTFRGVFFGLPLIAAVFFGISLRRMRPNNSLTPNSLRGSA